MCYSAMIWADYRRYMRDFGAELDIKEFVELFWRRNEDWKVVKLPKAMEQAFAEPQTAGEHEIKALIDQFKSAESGRIGEELFAQKTRLAEAERKLEVKVTKAAADSKRIAVNKITAAQGRLDDLRRTDLLDRDARIFPGQYAPVMIVEDGRRVVVPMRYQCRPAGKPAFYDTKFPGTYNARRDNLDGSFWKELFGYRHGLIAVSTFFENVQRDGKNVVLEFKPDRPHDMLVPCLWSRWSAPGEPDLLSFAVITDEPPAEVLAAGHDRCIVQILRQNVEEWLRPDPTNLARQYEILDDRESLHYKHQLAA